MTHTFAKGLLNGLFVSILLWILIILGSMSVFANTYYINQSGGSDSNNCSSLTMVCKTISKVNTLNLTAGDSVLFARNEMWRTLTDARPNLTSGVTYGAYGNGNQPMFLGSLNGSNMTWTNSSKVWNKTGITYDVGNIIFNATTIFGSGIGSGNKTYTYAGLLASPQSTSFYYDPATDTLSVYYTGNLTRDFSSIEIAMRYDAASDIGMFDYGNLQNVVIRDVDLRNGAIYAIHGIGTSTINNIKVFNTSTSWIGGAFQSGSLRFGNNLDCSMNCYNINFSNNRVRQGFDSGIGIQSWSGAAT